MGMTTTSEVVEMAEETEDYAVAAAREWLKQRYDYGRDHTIACEACKADVAQLAAIIRKHAGPEIEKLEDAHEFCAYDTESI